MTSTSSSSNILPPLFALGPRSEEVGGKCEWFPPKVGDGEAPEEEGKGILVVEVRTEGGAEYEFGAIEGRSKPFP